MTEQTEIAKKLGMSGRKFKLLVKDKLKFELIGNKRHYNINEVYELIRLALKESKSALV